MTIGTAAPTVPAATEPVAVTVYRPRRPLDLLLTIRPLLRGAGDPTMRLDASGVWRAIAAEAGPATLRMEQRTDGTVHAAAWGPGADEVVAGVPALLGADDDDTGFDCRAHPLLAEWHRRTPGLRLLRVNRVFELLAPSVLEQKVTSRQAWGAWRWLVRRFGAPAPGPAPAGLTAPPGAEVWRRIPSWDYHRAGVEPARSRTIVQAAAVAATLERRLDARATAPVAAAALSAALRSLPGIGVWTAAEVTQRAVGDPDSVSVGDYHLAHHVGEALSGRRVDDDGMLELLEPWRGHRQRVVRLIVAAAPRMARYGPRITIQDHRGH